MMDNVAANLPLEILHEIFQKVAVSFRPVDYDKRSRGEICITERAPRNNDIYLNFYSEKIHEFAKYRLVSKRWKTVADAFLFRDIYITLPSVREPRRGGARTFIRAITKSGYAKIIRRLHVNLQFYDYFENYGLGDEWFVDLFSAEVEKMSNVILESTGCRLMFIYIQFIHHIPVLLPTMHRFLTVLPRIPERCPHASLELKITFPSKYIGWESQSPPRDLGVFLDNESEDESPGLGEALDSEPDDNTLGTFINVSILNGKLVDILTYLEMDIYNSVSPVALESLHFLTALYIHRYEKDLSSTIYDAYAAAIHLLPNLVQLELEGVPFTSFPPRLRTLRMSECPFCIRESIVFWRSLLSLSNLEDLYIFFSENLDINEHQTIDLVDVQPSLPRYSNLHTLQVIACPVAQILNDFCATVLHSSSCLKTINLIGIHISNEILVRISSQCLRELTISSIDSEQKIFWSTITNLLQRNSLLEVLRLRFNLRLPPMTFEDIEQISAACPKLPIMSIHNNEMINGMLERRVVSRVITEVDWLFTKSESSRHDDIMRRVSRMHNDPLHGNNLEIIVDLDKFRRLNR
jgi:hypothetical protein